MGVAVPPLPTPHLPVFRGPQEGGVAGGRGQPNFQPVNTDIRVVEGGTAFLQCRIREEMSQGWCVKLLLKSQRLSLGPKHS